MKHLIICLTLLVFYTYQTVNAQSWTQKTSNTNKNLWGVAFINNDTGLVCGDTGIILKTVDGGDNWSSINSGTAANLNGICFPDANKAYTFSWFNTGGIIFKSTDGGTTWNDISLNISGARCGGAWYFSADSLILAIGDTNYANSKILKTDNGGSTWDTVHTGIDGWVSFMHFPDADNGYAAVSGGKVIKTMDGGNNWTELDLGSSGLWTSGVWFFNKDTGFVGGGFFPEGGELYKTENGGGAWQKVSDSIGASVILFTTTSIGYIIGGLSPNWNNKKIIKTTDGGSAWFVDPTPKNQINGICFPSVNTGFSVGDSGTILKYQGITNIKDFKLTFQKGSNIHHFSLGTSVNFKISENIQIKNAEFKLYDLQGKQIIEISDIKNNKIVIDRREIARGVYYYRLIDGNSSLGSGKLILN